MVGVAGGAAVASANSAAASSNAYAAGVAAGSANTAGAYNAGVAAGAASAAGAYVIGNNYAALPAGCTNATVGGTAYYLCGNTWFKPTYGANGVYYRVVPTP